MHRLLLLLLSLSCASDPKPEDLDIKPAFSPPKTTEASLVAQDLDSLKGKQLYQWQNLFKQPPATQQKEAISQELSKEAAKPRHSLDELLKMARNYRSIGETAKSEVTYRELLSRHPENFDALLELAQIYLESKQLEAVYDYLAQAKKVISAQEKPSKIDRFRYRHTLALSHLASDRRSEAHSILSDLISEDMNFIAAYVSLAGSYLSENKLEMTEFIAKRGLEQKKDDPSLLNFLGIISVERGDLRKAEAYYNLALSKNPDHVATLINRAGLSLRKSEFESAEMDLKKALSHSPRHVSGLIVQGILFKRSGRNSSAKVAFETALEQNPESAYARYNLALLYAESLNERNTALRLFYEVLQASDNTHEIKEMAKAQIQGLRESRITVDDKY